MKQMIFAIDFSHPENIERMLSVKVFVMDIPEMKKACNLQAQDRKNIWTDFTVQQTFSS